MTHLLYGPISKTTRWLRSALFGAICVLAGADASAQAYFANGDARALGNDTYQLTNAATFQNGSVWYAELLDLSKPFDLNFNMYLGNRDQGADGIVLVLQTRGNQALGLSGGGIGFEGFSPSLGIEFDTYQNGDYGDPASDHIAVVKNGSVRHSGPNSIMAPVPLLVNSGNVEDNRNHLVRFAWEPASKNLRLWFDCALRVNITIDLVKDVFGGTENVYWGFTSATGGEVNVHKVELRDDIIIKKEFEVCDGDSIRLSAQPSKNDFYRWTPSDHLSSDRTRAPWSNPTEDMEYVVEYRDACDNVLFDTFQVDWSPKPDIPSIEDTLLCGEDAVKIVDWSNVVADEIRWNDGSTARRRELSSTGSYSISATIGHCLASSSFEVYKTDYPTVEITGPSALCEGSEVRLVANVEPDDASLLWSTGSDQNEIVVNAIGTYSVQVENRCGKVLDEHEVIERSAPYVDIGEDQQLCEGDMLWLVDQGTTTMKEWSTGETSDSILIDKAGVYTLEVEDEYGCTASDTVNIEGLTFPDFVLDPEILLCRNEVLVIELPEDFSYTRWNDGFSERTRTFRNDSGVFSIVYGNLCGEREQSTEVQVLDCYCNVHFPNAFSPNADALNGNYAPVRDCHKMLSYSIVIYNRWGQVVFKSDQWEDQWDGSYKGRIQPGVYGYTAEFKAQVNGFEESQRATGIIHVLK